MKFSLWASNNDPWSELVDLAEFVHSLGWHGYWLPDHYMSQTADDTSGAEPALDCWTTLAGIAVAVPDLELVSMVSPVTIHHPVVLAKRVVTVDQISGGRAVLGLGAGWQVNEHHNYGFELHQPGERVTHFIEAIRVVRQLLDDDRVTFDGRWYRLTDATFEPKPGRLPILVGTSSPRMLRTTAKYADAWNTWGTPDTVAAATERFHIACDAEGRDPATIRRSAQAMIFFADTDAKRDELRAKVRKDRSIVGGTAEVADAVRQYSDAGLDEFALPVFNLRGSLAHREETIQRFHEEVVSALT